MKQRKRIAALLMAGVMLFSSLPANALGAERQTTGSLCEHHPAHTAECGYAEGTEGTPCNHQHTDECYTFVTNCVHEHGADCYPAEGVSDNAAAPSGAETAEPTACTHVCSEESGCIKKELNCQHEHKVNGGEGDREDGLGRDSECGYTPATKGTPCTYVCPICPVQAQINALPMADELGNMTEEEQQGVYEKLQAAYDAYDALTDEQKEEIAGAEIFDSLFDAFNGMVNTLENQGNYNINENEVTIDNSCGDDCLGHTITGESSQFTIQITGGTHNITLQGVKIDASGCAFALENGAAVNLTLVGTNSLKSGAGYAGLQVPDGAKITINGSGDASLTAQGGSQGAGIGGGMETPGGNITITGGAVRAIGGDWAASIGDGDNAAGKKPGTSANITIAGGEVTLSTNQNSEGGCLGYADDAGATGGSVSITGGELVFQSKPAVKVGTITGISGCILTPLEGDTSLEAANDCLLVQGDTITVRGAYTLQEDFTLDMGETLEISAGATFNTGSAALTNNGTIQLNGGTLTVNSYSGSGTVYKSGLSTLNGAAADTVSPIEACIAGDFLLSPHTLVKDTDYAYENNTLTILNSTPVTISGSTTADKIAVNGGVAAKITLDGLSITSGTCAFTIPGTASAEITLVGDNTLKSGSSCAGLAVEQEGTVTIGGAGSLQCIGGWRAAGIGGGQQGASGTITINGGAVTATGGESGAGIGGGYDSAGQNITINGGTVTAAGGEYGAGIGGGHWSDGKGITINGGTVTATGGWGATGIGGGYRGSSEGITITNGSVKASSIRTTPTDGDSNSVYLAKLEVPSGVNEVALDSGTAQKTFKRAGDHPDGDTAFYLYLTKQDHEITVSNTKYKAIWDNSSGSFTVKRAAIVNVSYIEYSWDENAQKLVRGDRIANEPCTLINADNVGTDWTAGWYVVEGEVTLPSRVMVTGEVHLILQEECRLTAGGGIQVETGSSLTIYAQSEDKSTMGHLTATSGDKAAGIGGGDGGASGSITINGGTVTAECGGYAAGIGGGDDGDGECITIYGGIVTAESRDDGAGIGGGYGGAGQDITIYGGTVTAIGGNGGAGIGGGKYGGVGRNITIYGGIVAAESKDNGAGIGGGFEGAGEGITINGGTVTATGGDYGTGIGGGYQGAGQDITINGGKIDAGGGYYGAGIGGGFQSVGQDITINGGIVTAAGGERGAGIGGGFDGAGKGITINGGTVTATGGERAAGIGGGAYSSGENITITNGSVKASSISITPTDENDNSVYLAKLEVPSGVNEVTLDSGTAPKTFKRAGDHPDGDTVDTAFYLYLTGQDHEITVSDTKYKALWNGRDGFAIRLPVSAPTVRIAATTASSITVEELENKDAYGGAEYSLDGKNWQTSNVLTGLHSDRTYTVYARYKGDTIYAPSDAGKLEGIRTNAASYTITIPADTLEAGKADSSASIKINTEKTFDLGYNGHVDVTVKKDSSVTADGKLKLTRQNDTENHTITSALLIGGTALGNIDDNVAAFTMDNKTPVSISFAKPTEPDIPAGTYSGTITFEVSYTEPKT